MQNDQRRYLRFLCRTILLLMMVLLAGCDYARMTDDEAVNTYQTEMPAMDERTVPVQGPNLLPAGVEPRDLVNPQPISADSVERGRVAYGYYCVHCHGPKGDGYGTVGQSFAPKPADLASAEVLNQSDGELFYKITVGFKRHPPLGNTVAAEDRWAVINYLRAWANHSAPRP